MVSVDYCLHKQCIKPSLRNIWNNNVNYVSAIIWILSVNSAGKKYLYQRKQSDYQEARTISLYLMTIVAPVSGLSSVVCWCSEGFDIDLQRSAYSYSPPPGIWRFSLLTRASGSSVVHRENSCSDLVAGCSAKRSLEDDRCRKESVWVSETERWR